MQKLTYKFFSIILSTVVLLIMFPIRSFADETDLEAQIESRKNIPIESNNIPNWPVGPVVCAESAILMDVDTGIVLYEKNIHEKLYPASITKILTALIAYEHCSMNETVTFSYEAVSSIDWRYDANMGIHAGDSITLEQAMYGMLVGSANEAAYAIAEHVSGDLKSFADLMNEKAAELGCTESHFVTPNGIHDDDHYTSAHDMALIAQAFFSNDYLASISNTPTYKIPASATQPNDDMVVYAKSKLFPQKEYAYEYLIGTKTGYTESARQTLVSCAQKDTLRLVCVVMKDEAPSQYTDTIDLFNYGFSNFLPVTIADKDNRYSISTSNLFDTKNDIFGSSKPILKIDPDDRIILPVGTDPDNTESKVVYEDLKDNELARIEYYYSGTFVGSASVVPASEQLTSVGLENDPPSDPAKEKVIFLNIYKVLGYILAVFAGSSFIFILISLIRGSKRYKRKNNTNKNYNYEHKKLNWKHFK